MARNPVFLSPSVKFESISVEFTSLIVAVFRRISLEYTYERILSILAIHSIDFESIQRRTEICFCSKTSNFARNFTP